MAGVLAFVLAGACRGESEASPASTRGATATPGSGAPGGAPSPQGGSGPAGTMGGPGGAGAMRMPTVLGPSDVLEVKPGRIESAITISGDLKPIEEIAVRSRVDGIVVAVAAREGDRVGRGQLLARFESTVQEGDRASAAADLEAAKSDRTNAQWNADQSAELFKAGAIPERDLRTAQQALSAAAARVAAAEARVRSVLQTLEDTRVVAPTTGVVSARTVEAGEHVSRGGAMFTVVRNDVLELEASVPSRQAGELKPGQVVRFSAGGLSLEGRVARISPTINPQNRTLTVYLQVPNARGELRGNTFATGRIVTRTIEGAIVVPVTAVRQSQQDNKPFVYRIVDDKVDIAPIEPGVTDDQAGTQEVLSGLAVGDRIIVGNLGVLGRGMPVRVVAPEGPGARGARDMGSGTAGAGRGVRPPAGAGARVPGADSTAKR